MIASNEFWLHLHRLAEAYDAEGLNTEERATNIISQFLEMPVIAQRHVLSDLISVATHVPDLYPLVLAGINKQQPHQQREKVG